MSDVAGIDLAIMRMYEAIDDDNLWSPALREIIRLLGGFDGQLLIRQREAASFLGAPLESSIIGQRDYASYWVSQDVRRVLVDRQPVGKMIACNNYFDNNFVANNAFYQEFLVPSGWRYAAGGKIMAGGGTTAYLAIHRLPDQGPFESHEISLLERMAPFLEKALLLRHKLADLQGLNLNLEAVYNRMSEAIFIVDADRKVLFINQAADKLVSKGDEFIVHKEKFRIAEQNKDNVFSRALADATATSGRRFGTALKINRRLFNTSYAVEIAPLSPQTKLCNQWQRPLALLIVVDPDRRITPSGRRLIELFGLTSAEARVAVALGEGKTPIEIAMERKISIATVRSQLAAVLSKTKSKRKTDLISLLASLGSDVSRS